MRLEIPMAAMAITTSTPISVESSDFTVIDALLNNLRRLINCPGHRMIDVGLRFLACSGRRQVTAVTSHKHRPPRDSLQHERYIVSWLRRPWLWDSAI